MEPTTPLVKLASLAGLFRSCSSIGISSNVLSRFSKATKRVLDKRFQCGKSAIPWLERSGSMSLF